MTINKAKVNFYKLIFVLIFSISQNCKSQTNSENSITNWFDNIVGIKNLGVNNGPLHTDPYITSNNNHNYYISPDFSIGNVFYDGQFYKNIYLKYDIYKDLLVIKTYGDYNYKGLELNKEKTNSFSINGEAFIHLNTTTNSLEIINGFYEQSFLGDKIKLYTNHKKKREKLIKYSNVYDEFTEEMFFIINYNQTFYQIYSKKDLIKIIPKLKKQIKDYYFMNSKMERNNKKEFMKNLIKHINNFLQYDSK
jgi:hypothetical protein